MVMMRGVVVFLLISSSTAKTAWENAVSEILPIIDNIESSLCRKHVMELVKGFQNFETWALTMADASAKLQSGILQGNIKNLGQYDQCVEARGNQFTGQYCLANVQVAPLPDAKQHLELTRVIDTLTLGRLDREITTNRTNLPVPDLLPSLSLIQLGICLPSSCSPRDVELILGAGLHKLATPAGLHVSVQVPETSCFVMRETPWTLQDIAFISIVVIFVALMAAGTILDVWPGKKNKTSLDRILGSFSLYTNFKKVFTMNEAPSGTYAALEGIRVLSTVWVVLGHKVTTYLQEPWVNKFLIVENQAVLSFMPIVNNMISVDTFFLISGLLKANNFLRELENNKFDFFKCYARRYLRLTPAYALVIMFYATLMPRVGSGPTWHCNVELPSAACQNSWFLNLLYVNNYIGTDNMCMIQTWYLAADMQLHLLAPLILYPAWRWPKHTLIILTVTVVTSVAVPLLYIYNTEALPLYAIGYLDEKLIHYVQAVHIATHTRASPFVLGLVLGYFIFKFGVLKLSKFAVILGWTVSIALLIYAEFGAYKFVQYHYKYDALEASIFGALHRPAWALGVAWIIYACYSGYGGWINRMLSATFWQPYSRISYCVYLSHYVILMIGIGRMRTAVFINSYDLTHDILGDLTISAFFALILHLLVEAPMLELTKMLFQTGKSARDASKLNASYKTTQQERVQSEKTLLENHVPLIKESNGFCLKAKQR